MAVSLNLIPTPQFAEVLELEASITGASAVRIVTLENSHRKAELAARMIKESFEKRLPGLAGKVQVAREVSKAAMNILLIERAHAGAQRMELTLLDREALERSFEQGYILKMVDPSTLYIVGSPQGILFGTMTLLQLVQESDAGLKIQGAYVRDFPHFEFRCAADWLSNGEGNRCSMDRGQGWERFETLCKRKIDQCLHYKINAVILDGFGWGLEKRAPEYPGVMRRLNAHARERGISLCFGGYGAGYGMEYQLGPLYEDAAYLGEVFKNREHYPDGPTYQCTGETRGKAIRKGVDTRILGTCRSNEELNRLKARELQDFVRSVEPGILYIHHEDYGGCNTTGAAWQWRCERCRVRWPNNDVWAADGAAGGIAAGYTALINAVNAVTNPETDYVATRDCQILLTSPVYCLGGPTSEDWNVALRFWQNACKQLPRASNVQVCFREIFPLKAGGGSWTESFNFSMREAGLPFGALIFSIIGGDHWMNDYPVVSGCALNNLFLGARAIFHDNGDAYQEPQQLLNAEYCWNVYSSGFYKQPRAYQEAWDQWLGLCDNELAPPEIFGESGFLRRACARLYGKAAAGPMAQYFGTYRRLNAEDAPGPQAFQLQDAAPERKQFLPMTWNKIYAVPALWRALALDSKTWGAEIDNQRYVVEMGRLEIDRPELHRRLKRRWDLTREMLEFGAGLLQEAQQGPLESAVREDLQFLLQAAQAKLPLARALSDLHTAIQEQLKAQPDAGLANVSLQQALGNAEQAASLAEEFYPAIVDPVAEPGALKTCAQRLLVAIRWRMDP